MDYYLTQKDHLIKVAKDNNVAISYDQDIETIIAALTIAGVPGYRSSGGSGGGGLTNAELRASPLPLASPRQKVIDASATGIKSSTFTITAGAAWIDFEVLTGTVTVNDVAYTPSGISGQEFGGKGDLEPALTFTFDVGTSAVFQVMRYA